MAKLEDLFNASLKKPKKLLDFAHVKIFSEADFDKYLYKVPEMKLRPDIVTQNDAEIITDFSFTLAEGHSQEKYEYEDPLLPTMRSTRLEDFWTLDIHWKMLTSDRPPNKLEEEHFERLVDLGRFSRAARKLEQATVKAIMSSIAGTPAVTYLVALGFVTTRSKRGAVETRLKMCKNCQLELCTGAYCKLYDYEPFTRIIMDKEELENQEREEMTFLKQVVSGGAEGCSNSKSNNGKQISGNSSSAQGKKLKMKLRKSKRKKKRRKKKATENLEPVSVPQD